MSGSGPAQIEHTSDDQRRSYWWWQRTLAKEIFGSTRLGQRVRLNFSTEDFPINQGSLQSLIHAVHEQCRVTGASSILNLLEEQAKEAKSQMRAYARGEEGGDDPPEFLPCLSLLVVAVHHGGDQFHTNDYYARLRDLMGYDKEETKIGSAEMARANRAWHELEKWSCRWQMGRKGLFEVRIFGADRHIGVPLRQAILSPGDEVAIVQELGRVGIEPNREFSSEAAYRIGRTANLRTRSARVLSEFPKTTASQELVDEIIEIYQQWVPDMEPTSIERPRRLQIRIQFKEKIPDLINTSATVVLPDGFTEPEESKGICIEHVEKRDGSCEISTTDGSSLAECVNWFKDYQHRCKTKDEEHLCIYRRPKKCLWFMKLGDLWVEQFEEELQNDRKYVELRESPSETPGAGSSSFVAKEWKKIDRPLACWARTFVYKPNSQASTARYAASIRGGIRENRRGTIYFDFGAPHLVWPESVANNPTVQVEMFDAFGNRTHLQECKPELVARDSSGFDEESIQTDSEYVLTLQTIIDPFRISGKCPVLLEASILGEELRSKVKIYFQKNVLQVQLEEPPTRNTYGEICELGQLQGTRGTEPTEFRHLKETQIGKPHEIDSTPPNFEAPTFRLSRLMRSRGRLEWPTARHLIQQCGDEDSFNQGYSLSNQLTTLHQIGSLEIIENFEGGFEAVCALPPRICSTTSKANLGMKPGGGFHDAYRFTLTGCWLPEELDQFLAQIERTPSLLYDRDEGLNWKSILPPYQCVLATEYSAIEKLQGIAESLNIQFEAETPDSLSSLNVTKSLEHYLQEATWRPGNPSIGYEVFTFDPRKLAQTTSKVADRYCLLECRNQKTSQWQYYIYDSAQNRHVKVHDRQLGRWVVRLNATPSIPVPIHIADLVVPLELRLPRHLERIFALETGRYPQVAYFDRYSGAAVEESRVETMQKDFGIPPPPRHEIRPYPIKEKVSGAFLKYPRIHGTAIWPLNAPVPLLGSSPKQIVSLSLTEF